MLVRISISFTQNNKKPNFNDFSTHNQICEQVQVKETMSQTRIGHVVVHCTNKIVFKYVRL
jgi:hypothetical protein